MYIVIFVSTLLGIAVGVVLVFWAIMESPAVRGMELGAIVPMAIGVYFIGGMVIGDISWFIQTWDSNPIEYTNPFIVNP